MTLTVSVKFFSTKFFQNTKVSGLGKMFIQQKFSHIQWLNYRHAVCGMMAMPLLWCCIRKSKTVVGTAKNFFDNMDDLQTYYPIAICNIVHVLIWYLYCR